LNKVLKINEIKQENNNVVIKLSVIEQTLWVSWIIYDYSTLDETEGFVSLNENLSGFCESTNLRFVSISEFFEIRFDSTRILRIFVNLDETFGFVESKQISLELNKNYS
jgi:hypothetical protein